jgi:hypothetical protein
MSAGRIVGGIIALVAGALLLIGVFWSMAEFHMTFGNPIAVFNLVMAALMIVGGVLGLAKLKTVGGILALIGGVLSMLGGLLAWFTPFYYLWPLSFFFLLAPSEFTYYFATESIIAIVGAIILLVSSKE